jgi:hypothetical protein
MTMCDAPSSGAQLPLGVGRRRRLERLFGEGRGSFEGRQRWLWLSGRDPRTPDSGLLAYSDGLLRAVAHAGGHVVGLGLRRTDAGAARNGRILWHSIDSNRRTPIVGLLTLLPNMAASHATRAYRRCVDEALQERWDAVVIDHLQMGWVIDRVVAARAAHRVGCVIHVSHNHETSVRERAAQQSGSGRLPRAILRLDAWKVGRLERAVVAAADVVTCITAEDRDRFVRGGSSGRLVVVPPGYDGAVQPTRQIDGDVPRRAVLLGNTLWRVKRENLLRFLEVADPVLATARVELIVAGPSPPELVATLAPRLRATRFVGAVDDVAAVLRTARVGVVAEPVGGGFKMKSLDYVFNRVPIAALAGSIAGLPLEPGTDMLSFTSAAELSRGIVDVIDDLTRLNALQEHAFLRCAGLFDWSERGRQVVDEVIAHAGGTAQR